MGNDSMKCCGGINTQAYRSRSMYLEQDNLIEEIGQQRRRSKAKSSIILTATDNTNFIKKKSLTGDDSHLFAQ